MKEVRSHWYLLVKIPRDTLHAEIHHQVMCVPPPSGASAKKVYERLISLEKDGLLSRNDSAEKRLDLITFLFKANEKETAKALEKQMVIVHEFYKANPDTKKPPD